MVYVHANVLLMNRKIYLKSQGLLLVNILGQVDNKKVGNPCLGHKCVPGGQKLTYVYLI